MLVTWHMTKKPNKAMWNPGWKMRWYYFYAVYDRYENTTKTSVQMPQFKALEKNLRYY